MDLRSVSRLRDFLTSQGYEVAAVAAGAHQTALAWRI
jgi:hypothetical protein